MQCIFRANMADNINTPGVATPNEGKLICKLLCLILMAIHG